MNVAIRISNLKFIFHVLKYVLIYFNCKNELYIHRWISILASTVIITTTINIFYLFIQISSVFWEKINTFSHSNYGVQFITIYFSLLNNTHN